MPRGGIAGRGGRVDVELEDELLMADMDARLIVQVIINLVNNAVTITAGIQAGDRIVTDGMQKIGQGSKVIAE